MARTKGAKGKINMEVKSAVKNVFSIVNKDNAYLLDLAANDKPLFNALILKCIPQEMLATIDVMHTLDLGLAMQQASDRLEQFNSDMLVIDQSSQPKNRTEIAGANQSPMDSGSLFSEDKGGVQGGDPAISFGPKTPQTPQ